MDGPVTALNLKVISASLPACRLMAVPLSLPCLLTLGRAGDPRGKLASFRSHLMRRRRRPRPPLSRRQRWDRGTSERDAAAAQGTGNGLFGSVTSNARGSERASGAIISQERGWVARTDDDRCSAS